MQAAALPELLRWVVVEQAQDPRVARRFLYRSSFQPTHVWSEVMRLPTNTSTPVVNLIKLWLSCCYENDFARSRRLRGKLLTFLMDEANKKISPSDINSLKLLVIRFASRAHRTSLNVALLQNATSCQPLGFSILRAWKTDDVCNALLSLSSGLTREIRLREFSRKAWQSDKRTTLAPTIVALSEYFNRMSFWIVTEILRG